MDHRQAVNRLFEDALRGHVSRRELLRRAAVLGVAVPGVVAMRAPAAVARSTAQGTPKPGGALTAVTVADPDSLDNHVSQLAQVRQITENIYDSLTLLDSTDLLVKPRLATEWAWTDPQTLAFTLRSGVSFHDGQPFGAEDVKFSLDRIKNPETASPNATTLEPVESVEVVDDTHVTLRLKTPWPALLEGLSSIFIYHRSATADSIREKPNGTGPFKFVEWKPNDYLRLERNPSYWNEGLPYLDQLDFKPVAEAETRISMMETQGADVMFTLPLKDVGRVEGNAALVVAFDPNPDNGDILYINNGRAPLDNPLLRLAVSHAVDRATYFEAFLGGNGERNPSPWVQEHWAYNPINDTAFPYDLDRARELLAGAGYPDGKNQAGEQVAINLVYPTGYPEWQQGSVMIQAALKEIGVETKVEELELATWVERIVKTDQYDLSWDFILYRAVDPTTTLNYAFFFKQGPQNICRYQDQQLADLAQRGATTLDQAERKPIYDQWQARWNEIAPGIVVGDRQQATLVQADVQGFIPNPLGYRDFSRAWLDRA